MKHPVHHMKHGKMLFLAMLVGIAAAFIVGLETGRVDTQNRTIYTINEPTALTSPAIQPQYISLWLPAIRQNGEGAVARLDVEIRNGSGRSFLRVDGVNPVVDQNTQDSIKTSLFAARGYSEKTRINLQRSDLLFTFSGTMGSVGGESAGAAMTVAAIALLNGKKLKSNVAISGVVSENGSIEPVGGILEKARALKNAGISTFLVPVGESVATNGEINEREECDTQRIAGGIVTQCRTIRNVDSTPINVGQEVGLNVVEVADVYRAYQLMIEE